MEDEYLDDAEFYDGLEEADLGDAMPRIWEDPRLHERPDPAPVPSWLWVPPDAPPPPARLLTAAEWLAKHRPSGQGSGA